MATLTNPLAPQLTGTLSAEVEQLVRERVSSVRTTTSVGAAFTCSSWPAWRETSVARLV